MRGMPGQGRSPLRHTRGTPAANRLRRGAGAASLLFAAALAAGEPLAPGGLPFTVERAMGVIDVDGIIDEDAWHAALTLELRYEYEPGENIPARERTEMMITFDDTTLYVAFKAYDSDPRLIRARFSDRDQVIRDDWVGVVLDTFNDERRAFEFAANPLGVQRDLLRDDVNGNNNTDWNAIWNSAGRITDDGFEVEMAIPFNQLRFQATNGRQIWGIDGLRHFPRAHRRRFSLHPRLRGNNSYLSQAHKIIGFDQIRSGRNLEVVPTLTGVYSQARELLPRAPLRSQQARIDAGITGKWGVTPNITLSATLNPDYSQIEADSVQLDINETFTLFFDETRPFFLDASDYFATPGFDLLHTRTVVDPTVAIQSTARLGRHTFALINAQDNRTPLLIPGTQGSRSRTFDTASNATVGRYRFDFGRNSTAGAFITNRQGGGYHNRVLSLDTRYRLSAADSIEAALAVSDTRYAAEMLSQLKLEDAGARDVAASVRYERSTRNYQVDAFFRELGDGFRSDMGREAQVGIRQFGGGAGYSWYSDGESWFNDLNIRGDFKWTGEQHGPLIERQFNAALRYEGPLQSTLNVNVARRDRRFNGADFNQWSTTAAGNVRLNGGFMVGANVDFSDAIDFTHTRAAKRLNLAGNMQINLGRHLFTNTRFEYSRLAVAGEPLFATRVVEARLVYQFDRRFFVRGTLQYTDISRNRDLYAAPVDARSRDLLLQLLASYKINPQTVFYAGYSGGLAGTHSVGLTEIGRTAFVKLSYAWLL